jgi:hypothetical protein
MEEKKQSSRPAGHKERMCKLRKDGKIEEIDQQELNPIVFCNKCQAKAADPLRLCNPRALKVTKLQKG